MFLRIILKLEIVENCLNTKKIPLHTTLLPISKKYNPNFDLDLILMHSCSVLVTPRIAIITAIGLRLNKMPFVSPQKPVNKASSGIWWRVDFGYQPATVVLSRKILFYLIVHQYLTIMMSPTQTTGLTILMLTASNIFMTFAWYGHLKNMSAKPWIIAALVSWGIALFEYLLQVPANRIGFSVMSLAQLKITQEVITLAVFVPFAVLYMGEPLRLNYLWAGICLMGAVYFIFKA
jgi:uncharacterized protein